MSRTLTRKDFLIFGAASAGTAFVAGACGSNSSSNDGGAGLGPSGGASPGGSGGSAAGSSAGGASGGVAGSGTAGSVAGSIGGTPAGGAAGSNAGAGGKAGSSSGGSGGKAGASSGGAGGVSGSGGSGTIMCTADVVAKISCPHSPPHTLTIAKADIDAAVADKVFTLSMALGHTHTITMTAADWTTLKSGGTVFKYVEAGGSNQDHCVVLSCGAVDAAAAAGDRCGGTAPPDGNSVMCTAPWP